MEHPDEFWAQVWERCGVLGTPGDTVVAPGEHMSTTRFFPEARLNVAENLLARALTHPDDEAVVNVDESGRRRAVTWRRLGDEVAAVAAHLRSLGVVEGDRVAAWMPNVSETIVAMLGAASIGAVFCSTSPDFGVDGVLDRFGQIEPVVLFAADGYRYNGRVIDGAARLAEIREGLPTLRDVVLVGHLGDDPAAPATPDTGDGDPASVTTWGALLDEHLGTAADHRPLPFDHPWYILFSSGTTGAPKAIVHRCGGVLIQHRKEHQFHCDIRPGDRVLYFTTCGWMMWNWLASVLGAGATAYCYDGAPFHPDPMVLLSLAEREALTFLGVSAKYIDALRAEGVRPDASIDLSSVRTIASTGSPLSPEAFRWVYDAVSPTVHLASISGGTDLCSCFILGDPTRPVYAGEIQGPGLGMAVDVFDEQGFPAGVGERGELVCTEPFPSMPLRFWGDDRGAKYRAAYFERFDGVWAHGDFASWSSHGGMVVHGRSDTTLNPGGVRIGTAEIYRRVEEVPEVRESLVFGQPVGDDVRIVLLVVLDAGESLTDELVGRIKRVVREGCTPRHVPAVIAAVEDLPRTRSGKLAELAVGDAVAGRPVRNTSGLANPEMLDVIAGLPELALPLR